MSVQHSVNIQTAGVEHGGTLFKIVRQPLPEGSGVSALPAHILQIVHGHGENTVIFVELAVLVVGEAGHQVGTQSPGVTQQQLLAVGQSRAGHDYQD